MNIHDLNPDFFNKPVLLTEEEKKNPLLVIEDFFSSRSLCSCRKELDNWLRAAITTDNDEYSEPLSRANLLYFREGIEKLIEATFMLTQNDLIPD